MGEVKEKRDQAKEIIEKEQEIKGLTDAENIVKDNKIEFLYKEEAYRVKLTNNIEKQQAEYQRMLKRQELLADNNYWTEEKWEKKWKERGRDSKELRDKVEKLKEQREELMLDLEDFRKEGVKADTPIKQKEDQIKSVYEEMKIASLMLDEIYEYTVQNKLEEFSRYYTIYQVLEKKVEDKWVRVYETFDKFMQDDNDNLVILASSKLSWLIVKHRMGKNV